MIIEVELKSVVSNQDNAREPAPALQSQGYGVCEPVAGVNKPTLFGLALGSTEEKKLYCSLIDAHEPGIAELARSLGRRGLLQPCRVRKVTEGYALTFGARRCLAVLYLHALSAGKSPATVWATESNAGERDALLESFDENYFRAAPSPIDEARMYARMQTTFGWSLREVAEHCGLGENGYQTVRNRLELLKLSEEDQARVHAGKMTLKAAFQKLGKGDPPKPSKGDPSKPGEDATTEPIGVKWKRPHDPDFDNPEELDRGGIPDYFSERDRVEAKPQPTAPTDDKEAGEPTDTGVRPTGDGSGNVSGVRTYPAGPSVPTTIDDPEVEAHSSVADAQPQPTRPDGARLVARLNQYRTEPASLPKQFQKKVVNEFVAWLLTE